LPRVVVDNSETGEPVENTAAVEAPVKEDLHDPNAQPVNHSLVGNLRAKLDVAENKENFAIFADSIGSLYASSGKFDSAAYYYALAADKIPAPARLEKAGSAYYEAYSFAMNPEKMDLMADKTRTYLNKVLEEDASRLDLKSKIAMTYVSAENPMQGIAMLREILDEDPQNESALFNMGVLSMQSGQYRKAVERFEDLVGYHPDHIQGQFYLAVSYFESKQMNKAKKQFGLVRNMTQDPMILNSVESYLDKI